MLKILGGLLSFSSSTEDYRKKMSLIFAVFGLTPTNEETKGTSFLFFHRVYLLFTIFFDDVIINSAVYSALYKLSGTNK